MVQHRNMLFVEILLSTILTITCLSAEKQAKLSMTVQNYKKKSKK